MLLTRSTKSAISEREFMNRVHMELTIKRFSIVLAAVTILGAAPALSQAANQTGQPCPGTATVGAGEHASNSADNPASEQGVEHSAILPEAGGEDSAAPTIKKDGQEVTDTGCLKPPNQLPSPAKRP
ncbi:MAG TPA: hypothetical protein VI077_12450 [Pseudolabrys sp.]